MAKKAKKKVAKKAAAAAPGAAAMAKARTIVIAVLRKRFGNTVALPDDLPLSKLKFNPMNLAGLAQNIRDAGVPINNAPIQVCKTIIDVITAVARVIEAMP